MFKIFKGRKSDVLSALAINDAAFWGADVFVGVIFALFITQTLGGSAIDVGLMYGLYRGIRALIAIPVGRFFDNQKGHFDEYHAILLAGVIVGLTYISMSFATELWHVYIGMAFIAIGHIIDNLAWKVLFYTNVPRAAQGQVMGIYEVTSQFVYGLAMIVAGFVGETYGFDTALMFAGFVTMAGTFTVLSMYKARSKF
tara:strand:+ start:3911 stop:4504 length:594 start_codon:yes stop_codon:yes gene_type:complete